MIFLYLQDINVLDKNIFYEFEYVNFQILCYKHPCCFWGTLFYEVHPPVLDDMSIDTGPAVHKRFVTVTKETISRESLRKHYTVGQIGCENL